MPGHGGLFDRFDGMLGAARLPAAGRRAGRLSAAVRPVRRRVTIFGATGSIGCNTVDLIAARPEALRGRGADRRAQRRAAGRAGARAARRGRGDRRTRTAAPSWRDALAGTGIEAAAGEAALIEAADAARRLDHVGHRRRRGAGAGAAGAGPRRHAGARQQGIAGRRRAAADGDGAPSTGRDDPAGGQRTFGGVPGACGRGYGRGRAGHHHRLGRRLPRLAGRAAGRGHAGAGRDASELGHGAADHRSTARACSTRRWS